MYFATKLLLDTDSNLYGNDIDSCDVTSNGRQYTSRNKSEKRIRDQHKIWSKNEQLELEISLPA
jgi:hypothetical protein